MTPDTVRALRQINERFYRMHGGLFASKRTRPWPGMKRLLELLPAPPKTVLDVGCGHGRFAAHLAEPYPDVEFTGVDGSETLLEIASGRDDLPKHSHFVAVDFEEDGSGLPPGPYDLVTLIAVIHHVPQESRRRALLSDLAKRVAPGGLLAVAFWRLQGDLDKRRIDWSEVGLDATEMEAGDRLTSFDGTPDRLRYAHFADDAELDRLEDSTGIPLLVRYVSDGPSEDANAYLVWRKPA